MFFLNSLYNLLETITEYALNELYDEKEIMRKIRELAVLYELDEIGEAEYDLMEKKLLAQLKEAKEYRKRMEEEDNEGDAPDEQYPEDEDNPEEGMDISEEKGNE